MGLYMVEDNTTYMAVDYLHDANALISSRRYALSMVTECGLLVAISYQSGWERMVNLLPSSMIER